MSVQSARGYLGISEVLAQLRADFPDISVSKIRFLETEGLITPARSPSGYRRFSAADVDRLKYILTAQRDQYLPLRVIRERLDRADRPDPETGAVSAPGPVPGPVASTVASTAIGTAAGAPSEPPVAPGGLTRRELVEAAGVSDALLTELDTFGLLRRVGRYYGADALQVARTAGALTEYGVEARHLRAVRAAAERETTMIESLVAPVLRQRGAGAAELASRTARELALLVLQLHGALVEAALAEAGLAPAGLAGTSLAATGTAEVAAAEVARTTGVRGASA
jgi:DNA-binding transcriptional MerR regulator